jgi:glycosyltransferase involved in cell wall biosynthesis
VKPDLVIITREYPYGNSETFLESEIPVLSRYFNKIFIYPSTSHGPRRDLPLNVEVDDLICRDYSNKAKWILRTLFSKHTFQFLWENRKRIRRFYQLKAIFKYCTSFTIYKKKAFIISNRHNCLIYSYWYNVFVDSYCSHSKILKKKIVTRVHGGDLYEERAPIGYFLGRRRSVYKVQQIFSISRNGETYLLDKYPQAKVSTSRLGVNAPKILNQPSEPNFLSLISVSNLIEIKNVLLIAEAIVDFSKNHSTFIIKWHHFGDGPLWNKINLYVSSLNIPNLIITLHGRKTNAEVLSFYEKNPVDLFINLSFSEGIPVSIMEAISYGIPVLATNVGGVREIVNGINGELVSPFDSKEYISVMLATLTSRKLDRLEIKKDWEQHFSSEINYTDFSKSLQKESAF